MKHGIKSIMLALVALAFFIAAPSPASAQSVSGYFFEMQWLPGSAPAQVGYFSSSSDCAAERLKYGPAFYVSACYTAAAGAPVTTPGGTANQLQYDAAGVLGGFTMSGDCTVVVATGVITCPQHSWMGGSSNAVVSASTANFFPANGTGAPVVSTSEGDVAMLAPTVAVLSNLTCVSTTIAGVATVAGGTAYTIALRQNIASSTLTCAITAAISTCADTNSAHNVTTAIGDQLDFIVTPTGTPTAEVVKCSVEVTIS